VTQLIALCKTRLQQIVALSDDSLIATALSETGQHVFLVHLPTRTIRSVLKESLERLTQTPITIAKSASGEFFVLIISCAILLFYHVVNGEPHLLRTELCPPKQTLVGCFADDTNDVSLIDNEWIGEKFRVDLGSSEPVYRTRMSRFARGGKLGSPTICQSASGRIIVGTDSGNLVICDWSGEANIVLELSHRPIADISVSPDCRCAIVSDAERGVALVNLETVVATQFEEKTAGVRFMSQSIVLENSGAHMNFNLRNSRNFDLIVAPVNPALSDSPLHEPVSDRKKLLESQPQLPDNARRLQFTLFADLLASADDTAFVSSCFGANLAKERLHAYLDTANKVLECLNAPSARTLTMRNCLIRGDQQGAFALLISSSPDSPSFSLDILKAGLVNTPNVSQTFGPAIAALIGAGKFGDAVDVLMVTGQFREAVRVLLGEGNVELALHIIVGAIGDPDTSILDQVVTFLLSTRNWKMAAQVLIIFGHFDRASDILREEGFVFPLIAKAVH
jgi:hypothetical protein